MEAWTRNYQPGLCPDVTERALGRSSFRGRRWLRDLRTVLIAAAAAALLLTAGFAWFLEAIDHSGRPALSRSDGIVVLTGGSQRISDGIDLLAQGYGRRLLITGVNEKTSRDEIARLNPGQRRLFDCCVDLDYRARNTIGNAIETRRWTQAHGFRSLIVVTSNYHMPRTLMEIGHVLPQTAKLAYPVTTSSGDPDEWWRRPHTARLLVTEYLKTLVSWGRTLVEGDPESAATARLVSRGQAPVKVMADPLHR